MCWYLHSSHSLSFASYDDGFPQQLGRSFTCWFTVFVYDINLLSFSYLGDQIELLIPVSANLFRALDTAYYAHVHSFKDHRRVLMNTGSIVDFYDDPYGTVLKTKLAHEQLPDYVRNAQYQDQAKLESLSDDSFALVMVDQGHKLRKFACVDKGNTALSVIYFMENKDKLPEEAQKVAAANLVSYCEAFGIEPPFQLTKIAGLKRLQRVYRAASRAADKEGLGTELSKTLRGANEKFERRMGRYGKKVGDRTGDQYRRTIGVPADSASADAVDTFYRAKGTGPAKTGSVKEAMVGPILDIGNLGIPSAIGYALGRGEGMEMARSKVPMDPQSLAAALLLPGALGYRYGKASGYRDARDAKSSHKKKKADATGSDIMPLQSARNKDEMETDAPISTQKISCGGSTKMNGADIDDGEDASIKSASVNKQALSARLITHAASGKPEERVMRMAGKLINKGSTLTAAATDPRAAARGLSDTFKNLGHSRLTAGTELMNNIKVSSANPLYVDVTGKSAPLKLVKHASQRYCLVKEGQGKFPIDSYGDVVTANQWFEDNGKTLHPEDRREYCTKLAARADELGVMITDKIRKYAGVGYAAKEDVKIAVATRMQYWAEGDKERGILNGLMDKYASVQPEVFCEALRQFDENTGISHFWDGDVVDPWFSTYGFEKTASWEWSQGADHLTEEDLLHGVSEGDKIHQIKQRFGGEMAKGLAESPKEVFDSLPLDTKRIISRLFSDPQ